MGRSLRIQQIKDGSSIHAMWQSHNKSFLLEDDDTKSYYYQLLKKYAPKHGIEVHSFCIMSNHPHIYGTISSVKEFLKFQHVVNMLLARKINKKYDRCGQVIRERYKAVAIKNESHALSVMMYIDINPVAAGMVRKPEDYPWCSYHYYAHGLLDPLITPPPQYLSLGASDIERRKVYRNLVRTWLERERLFKNLPKS